MKRSKLIPLFMLGTLLSGCSDNKLDTDEIEVKQNTYATIADCQADWGTEDEACQPQQVADASSVQGTTTTQSHGTFIPVIMYMGPRYYYDRSTSTPMMITSGGTVKAVTSPIASHISSGSSGRAASVSTASVSRGGFGAGAHAAAGGGGHAGGGSAGG